MRSVLPAGWPWQFADDLAHARRELPAASALLLFIEDMACQRIARELVAIRKTNPWLPMAAVLPIDAFRTATSRAAEQMGPTLDAVFDRDDALLSLADALPTTLRLATMRRVARLVLGASHLSERCREAMYWALVAPAPGPSVLELGRRFDVHRGTLWKWWGASERPIPPPSAFLDWVMLLHAVTRKRPDESWRTVATELDLLPSSLARSAKRILGDGLTSLGEHPRSPLIDRFLVEAVGFTVREVGTGSAGLHNMAVPAPTRGALGGSYPPGLAGLNASRSEVSAA